MNTKPYLAFALVAGLGLALGACSSSSDDPPAMPDLTLDGLQMGATVMAGTHTISDDLAAAFDDDPNAAMYDGQEFRTGDMVSVAGLDLTCGTGPCSVTVNDDGTITTTGTIEAARQMAGPVEPPAPTELEVAQQAASDAADAAKTASDNAATAAENAMTAGDNLATMQTGEMSATQAAKAQEYADAAMDAYMDAKDASAAAAAATTITAAVRAQADAEDARDAAQAAEEKAVEYGDMAEESAMAELMIDGTVKSVGDSSVDATVGRTTRTVDKQTTVTGLLDEPTTTGAATNGRTAVAAVLTGSPPTAYVSPRVNAASRGTVKIGKMLDTSDDAARLTIITHHAGTNTVRVFADGTAADLVGRLETDGRIREAGSDGSFETAADDTFTTLKPVGEYYATTEGTASTGAETIDAASPLADGTQQGDVVSATAKAQKVYTYEAADDNDPATDETRYVRLETTTTTAGITTVTYQHVNIHVSIDRDGDGDNDNVEVMARIPGQAAYDHVHFGAWASLGDAKANGDQSPSGLGIGFVQSIGDGLTGSDMPNNGNASYTGNWAATIQATDPDGDGSMSMATGAASVTANFTKAEITAALVGLATLKGDIAGNTYSGTDATATGGGLDTDGDFTGSFSGGFYGAKADETAGIFDFSSDGNKAGAFRGAFGGQRDAD